MRRACLARSETAGSDRLFWGSSMVDLGSIGTIFGRRAQILQVFEGFRRPRHSAAGHECAIWDDVP